MPLPFGVNARADEGMKPRVSKKLVRPGERQRACAEVVVASSENWARSREDLLVVVDLAPIGARKLDLGFQVVGPVVARSDPALERRVPAVVIIGDRVLVGAKPAQVNRGIFDL